MSQLGVCQTIFNWLRRRKTSLTLLYSLLFRYTGQYHPYSEACWWYHPSEWKHTAQVSHCPWVSLPQTYNPTEHTVLYVDRPGEGGSLTLHIQSQRAWEDPLKTGINFPNPAMSETCRGLPKRLSLSLFTVCHCQNVLLYYSVYFYLNL